MSLQMLEVDDEKIIPLAKTESNLQNTSYDFVMEAFVLEDNLSAGLARRIPCHNANGQKISYIVDIV